MAVNDCLNLLVQDLAKFNKALKESDALTEGDARELYNELLNLKEEIKNKAIADKDNFFVKKADELISSRRAEVKMDSLQKYHQIETMKKNDNRLSGFSDETVHEGLLAGIDGTVLKRFGGRDSVTAAKHARLGKLYDTLYSTLQRMGVKNKIVLGVMDRILGNKAMDREVYQAYFAKHGMVPNEELLASLPKEAIAIADTIKLLNDEMFKMMEDVGIPISYRSSYFVNQIHDYKKIREVSADEWVKAIKANFSVEDSFKGKTDDEITKILLELRDDIVNGKQDTTPSVKSKEDKPVAGVTSQFLRRRLLEPRDGESAFRYNQQFGHDSLIESLNSSIEHVAKWTSIVEKFGIDPELELNRLISNTKKRLRQNPKAEQKFSQEEQFVRDVFDEALGMSRVPAKGIISKTLSNVRTLKAMALQGNTIFRSAPDISNSASNLATETGMNFFKAHLDILTETVRAFSPKVRQEAAELFHLHMVHSQGQIANRLGLFDVTGVMSKISNTYYKMNLLEPWTTGVKVGHTIAFSKFMANRSGESLDAIKKAHPNFARTLDAAGISAKEWDQLRVHALSERQGSTLMNVEALGKADLRGADKRTLQRKLAALFNDEAEFAAPTPGSRERVHLLGRANPNSAEGIIRNLSTQFLSFPVTMLTKNLKRTVLADGGERIFRARSMAAAPQLMGLGVSMTALAYMGDSAIEMFKGRTPKDPRKLDAAGKGKLAVDMFAKSGAPGLFGDVMINMLRGREPLSQGPVMKDFNTLGQIIDGLSDPRPDKRRSAGKAFNLILNSTPGGNLFYLRGALDHFYLYNVQESISPGYTRRLNRRLREQGQERIFR